ncbi:MAG TPA: membrane protein insertase YidC [Gemmatimonadaceae bacterium]|nr:membrane protein insertase YidC [Gemmatimonadaceae bacterium]
MLFWSPFLDLLRAVLFAFAHVCGGSLGGGIVVLSLIVRLALLPLTYRLALRGHEYQMALRRLKPQLDALKDRHGADPLRLAQETRALQTRNGIGMTPKGTFLGALVQMPIGAGIYQTIGSVAKRAAQFLWIHDLSRPDALVASVAAGLAGAAVAAGPSSTGSRVSAALAAGVTFVVAWRLSAGVGLYWVASNIVGVVQSFLVRRAAATADTKA